MTVVLDGERNSGANDDEWERVFENKDEDEKEKERNTEGKR